MNKIISRIVNCIANLKIIGLGIVFMWPFLSASAQKLYTEISPSSGHLDDSFVFSVVLEDIEDSEYPYLTGGDDFKLSLIGPQSSINIVNGTVNRKIIYNYRLFPKRDGELETPAAEVEVAGEKLRAEPLKVKISKSDPNLKANEDAFLRQSVAPARDSSSNSLYVGQQAVLSIELYTSLAMAQPHFVDVAYDGVWSESFGKEDQSSKVIDGRNYELVRLKRALYPLRAGRINLPVRELQAKIRERVKTKGFPLSGLDLFDRDLMDNFFGQVRYKDIVLRSNALSLEVIDLPPEPNGLPGWNSISPLVGKTELKVSASKDELNVGDARTLNIEVTSLGNLNPLKTFPLPKDPRFKIYTETPEQKSFESSGALISRKIFKISIVPLVGGQLELPDLALAYFDPSDSKYKVAQAEKVILNVKGSSTLPKPEPKPEESTSNATHTTPAVSESARYAPESFTDRLANYLSLGLILLLLFALLLLLALGWLINQLRQKHQPRRAFLSRVRNSIDLPGLNRNLREFLVWHFKLDPGLHSSNESLKAAVKSAISNPELQFSTLALLDQFDTYLYGGGSQTANLAELRVACLDIIKQLR